MPMSAETKQRFEQEERAYWQQREELLKQFQGKWVAIVGGKVVAVAQQMNKAAAEAFRKTGSGLMYVNLVGGEDVVLRVRQVTLGRCDKSYTPPMPTARTRVSDVRMNATTGVTLVVDTGADLTLLQNKVADDVDLWGDPAGSIQVAGVGGAPEARQLYNAVVHVAGRTIFVTADCRDDIGEDILGRDVINEVSLTLCAKRGQVELEWVEEVES